MAMQTIPVSHPAGPVASFLSHPFRTLATGVAFWRAQHRRRREAARLMAMEPHIREDIGVVLAESHGLASVLKWHPSVLTSDLMERED